MKLMGVLITFLAMAAFAVAQPTVPAPEIDGSTLMSGASLIAGALLVARGRK